VRRMQLLLVLRQHDIALLPNLASLGCGARAGARGLSRGEFDREDRLPDRVRIDRREESASKAEDACMDVCSMTISHT
jgi:hypothetical protein